MKNIFSDSLHAISQGVAYSINVKNRSFKLNGKYIIQDGKYTGELGIPVFETVEEVLEKIYEYFKVFYFSPPSIKSGMKKLRFMSAKEHELSDAEMTCGEDRNVAYFTLQFFILGSILNGQLSWDENVFGKKFFWQHHPGSKCILIREDLNI